MKRKLAEILLASNPFDLALNIGELNRAVGEIYSPVKIFSFRLTFHTEQGI